MVPEIKFKIVTTVYTSNIDTLLLPQSSLLYLMKNALLALPQRLQNSKILCVMTKHIYTHTGLGHATRINMQFFLLY